GQINQELLLQNEYLAAENRILRAYLPARLRLSDPERSTLVEIGKRLGRKALAQVASVAKPDTEPDHDLEGIHSIAYGGVGRHRFLHSRSAHLAWVGDILHLVLFSIA